MSKGRVEQKVEESLSRLEGWVEGHGWEGWDPYDIRGKGAFRTLQSIPLVGLKLRLLAFAFPHRMRRIFRVEQRVYPEAMAAFSRAHFNLYRLYGSEKELGKAFSCLEWLEKNRCEDEPHFCWGAAFDWDYENLVVPKGTPDSTATSMAARAFLHAYAELGEERYLRIAESACKFLLRRLNIDHLDEESICFSYTPLDFTHVHNANLFNAALLALVGKELGSQRILGFARKAVNYTVRDQNPEGSWYYRGHPDQIGKHIDNYHTGFILRNLGDLYRVLGNETIREALLTGYRYYVRHLFLDSIPKLTPERLYPIDIYSCAEAILCLTTLGELLPEAVEKARAVAKWTIENMQDRKGYFYYRTYRLFTWRFPYIRWGQAIMLEALSCLLRSLGDV